MPQTLAIAIDSIVPIRKRPIHSSEMTNQLLFGEMVAMERKRDKWLKITSLHDNYQGWAPAGMFDTIPENFNSYYYPTFIESQIATITIQRKWQQTYLTVCKGATFYTTDSFEPRTEISFQTQEAQYSIQTDTLTPAKEPDRADILQTAYKYLNVPYLWGGRSLFGMDCSGFTQIVFRFHQIELPRDAWQQAARGNPTDFLNAQTADLAFFHNSENRVSHVGILLDNQQIIHAGNRIQIDNFSEKGIINAQTNSLTHNLHSIKNILTI